MIERPPGWYDRQVLPRRNAGVSYRRYYNLWHTKPLRQEIEKRAPFLTRIPSLFRRFMLWIQWWNLTCQLRSACARTRTFLWMSLCLAGMTVRRDLLGVTSIVRALGLEPACYDRLLDFFHSSALDLNKLTCAWCALVFRLDPGILRVNGRPVLVGDGIKVAKAGRKMRVFDCTR